MVISVVICSGYNNRVSYRILGWGGGALLLYTMEDGALSQVKMNFAISYLTGTFHTWWVLQLKDLILNQLTLINQVTVALGCDVCPPCLYHIQLCLYSHQILLINLISLGEHATLVGDGDGGGGRKEGAERTVISSGVWNTILNSWKEVVVDHGFEAHPFCSPSTIDESTAAVSWTLTESEAENRGEHRMNLSHKVLSPVARSTDSNPY